MSGVHREIALQALDSLPVAARRVFEPYREDLAHSSYYLDIFADKSMSAEAKANIDPEADRFLPPDPPRNALYRGIWRQTEAEAENSVAPLRWVYAMEFCLRKAVENLVTGDVRAAVKFGGIFSHIAGDTAEPIHAVSPAVIDIVVPPPRRFLGFELHAGLEGLRAPVNVAGYRPRLLGRTIPRAIMGAYRELTKAKQIGAALAVPMAQAIYAGKRKEAVRLSSQAQNQAARLTADFLHTVFQIAHGRAKSTQERLDLRLYPWARCQIDMLYRYQPIRDMSLIPYSGGKSHPMTVNSARGRSHERVRGLGVLPYLGPPWVKEQPREATVEYFLIPGAYRLFQARVGANPLFTDGICDAIFRVLADGRELWRSPQLSRRNAPVDVAVKLGEARWLTLAMAYVPDTNPTHEDFRRLHTRYALHGVWVEPRLTG